MNEKCVGFSYAVLNRPWTEEGVCSPKPSMYFPSAELPGLSGWSVVSYLKSTVVGDVDGYMHRAERGCFTGSYFIRTQHMVPDAWSCGEICNATAKCRQFYYFTRPFVGSSEGLVYRRKAASSSSSSGKSSSSAKGTNIDSSSSKSVVYYDFDPGDCVLASSSDCGYNFGNQSEIHSYFKGSASAARFGTGGLLLSSLAASVLLSSSFLTFG